MKFQQRRPQKKKARRFWLLTMLAGLMLFIILPLSGPSKTLDRLRKTNGKSIPLAEKFLMSKATISQTRALKKNNQEKQKATSDKLKEIPEETLNILKENKFLEEELKLARNRAYYFVINLKEKKIDLKARGMVLRSWKASDLKYSGKPVPLKVTGLTHKTALDPPERKIIQPGEEPGKDEKEANDNVESPHQTTVTFEVEALELADMPSSFELNFDDGLKISIQSKSNLKETFYQTWENILWYTWYPMKYFIFRRSELKPRLVINFENQREAQAIYWAFIDGIKGIIWFP